MFDPALLWRATDFWREGLVPDLDIRRDIKLFNQWKDAKTRMLEKNTPHYKGIEEATAAQSLPAYWLQDVSEWLWYVKEDGYLVSLSRDSAGRWSIHTRSGKQLLPPPEFLRGLEQNPRLPLVMVGELLTCFYACSDEERGDVGLRTARRNEQFAVLHRVLETRDPQAWVGLRVKIFSFPNSTMDVGTTYEASCALMRESLHLHPHIGMCRARRLQSTAHAIDMFRRVVQMGLEGIVIVNSEVKYGTKKTLDEHDDNVGTFYKLKQKVVVPGRRFRNTGIVKKVRKDGQNDGKETYESEFRTIMPMGDQEVAFTDRQDRETGFSRLKYMEYSAVAGNTWPCSSGYRHLHFTTADDMSVVVPAAGASQADTEVLAALGVTPQDRLFNPSAFALGTVGMAHLHKKERTKDKDDVDDKDKEDDEARGSVRKRQMSKRHMSGVWGSSNPGESCANPYVLDSEMICYYLTTI
jgi:hypothetical protein